MTVTAELQHDDFVYLTTEWRHKDLCRTIPGAKWHRPVEQWRIPVSWSTCLALRSTFREELQIGPELSAWATVERANRVDPCNKLRELTDWQGDPALFGWQRSGAEFIARGKQVLIADDPGCVDGDAEIIVERAGGSRRMTLRELHRKFHGGKSGRWGTQHWDPSVKCRTKSMFGDGTLALNEIVDVMSRGVKPVLLIKMKSGRSIRCTSDHSMSTGIGAWKDAGDLKVGDSLTINGIATCLRCEGTDDVIMGKYSKWRGYCKTCMYRYLRKDKWHPEPGTHQTVSPEGYISVSQQWDHPNANSRGFVAEHVLVATQTLNRSLTTDERVHHWDHNPSNNSPQNLYVTTNSEHGRIHGLTDDTRQRLHGTNGKRGEVWFRAHFDDIVSIEPDGETDVYDIEMAAPAHNFVVNGIVVHNSGKTATTIRGLARLSEYGENVFPILVVCPNSMKKTWEREFETWWPGVVCSIIKGSATERRKAFKEPAHVYIINWESLRSHSRLAPYGSIALKKCLDHGGEDPKVSENTCQVHSRELNKFHFGAIIADECHRAKDPKSQQTRALWAAAGDTRIRVALTGTPIANDVTDLWSILHFIAPHEWPSKTRWIDRFVDTMFNAWGGLMVIGVKAQMYEEFYAGLNPRMRRMPEDVVLSHLPPVFYQERSCEMGAKQKKAYRQLVDDMVAELDSGTLTVQSPLIKTTRLLQFASSYAEVTTVETTDEHGFPVQKQNVKLTEPSCKIDSFMDDIADFGVQQVAVLSVSRQLLELLSARLDKAKIPHGMVTGRQNEDERQRAIDDFQSGKTQFILFTAGAGGTGITLTAARYLCRLQVPYSLVDFKQSFRRVRRIGSERHQNIIVIDYVTDDTIDTKVFDALQTKGVSFEEVVRDERALLTMLKEKPVK